MTADRDLAIARAVLDWCKGIQDEHGLIGRVDNEGLREMIAEVDASLGGSADQRRAGRVQTGTEATDAEIARDGQLPGSDQSTGQPRVAEPPSDQSVVDAYPELAERLIAAGREMEHQRATGIMLGVIFWEHGVESRCWCAGDFDDPSSEGFTHEAGCLAARQYLAEAEAEQQKERQE